MRITLLVVATAALFLATANESPARTWYVAADGSGDHPTIQDAVNAASSGDVVLVGPGTYSDYSSRSIGSVRSACLFLKSGVTVQSESGPALTILDPNGEAEIGVVMYVATDAKLIGFTVQNVTHERGFIWSSGDCEVLDNHFLGVGLSNSLRCFQSTPLIQNNYFDGRGINMNGSPGRIIGNVVDGSDAAFAQGVWWVEDEPGVGLIAGNVFFECVNAGLLLTRGSPPVIGNTIVNCRNGIVADRANLDLRRNLVVGSWQIGMFTSDLPVPPVLECNNIWGSANGTDYAGEMPDPTGQNGNISEDPLFCDAGSDDFQLQWGSPCLPANSAGCGPIGARGFGGCNAVSIEPETWTHVKARYRDAAKRK